MANIKKMISCLLVAALLLSAMPLVSLELSAAFSVFAAEREAVDSGNVNENISWAVYSDGELVISGTGDMPDFNEVHPWFEYRNVISSIVVEEGITSISKAAFYGLYNAVSVSLPEGITAIKDGSFYQMLRLKELVLPSTVKSIGLYAFNSCVSLEKLILPEGLEYIDRGAFPFCYSLKELVVPSSVKEFCPMAIYGAYSLEKLVIKEGTDFSYSHDASPPHFEDGSLTDEQKKENEIWLNNKTIEECNEVFAELVSLEYLSIPSTVTTEGAVSLSAPFLKELRNASMRFAVKNPVSVKSTSSAEYQINDMLFSSIYRMVSSFLDDEINGILIYEDFDMDEFMYEICGFDYSLMSSLSGVFSAVTHDELMEVFNSLFDRTDDPFESFMECQLELGIAEELNFAAEGVPVTSNTIVYCYDDSAQHEALKACTECYCRHILLDDNKECHDEVVLEGSYTRDGDDTPYFSYRIDTATRTLILDGDGHMPTWEHDYDEATGKCPYYPPWVSYSHLYDTIVFAEDSNIRSISEKAFMFSEATDIYIPSSVKQIGPGAFFGCKGISLHIAKGSYFYSFDLTQDYTGGIKEYIVEEGHESFFSYDGALYLKGDRVYSNTDEPNEAGDYISLHGPVLLHVPQSKTSIEIMEGTRSVDMYAFFYSDVEAIDFPDSMEKLMYGSFYYCFNLKSLNLNSAEPVTKYKSGESFITDKDFVLTLGGLSLLDEITADTENGYFYIDESGAVLSKDKKILFYYPEGKTQKDIVIPEGVEATGEFAFGINEYAESLVIPASVKSFGNNSGFMFLKKLTVLNPELDFNGNQYLSECSLVIYGYPGSTAEAYAEAYGHEFVPISGCVHTGGEATCESLAVCDLCGQEYGTLGDHIPESYTENESCTVNGYTMTYCAVCFEELDFEVIEAKHLWPENYTVITPATCTQEGLEKRACQRCSEEETQVIPVADHDYSDEFTIDVVSTCTENGSMSRHCENCSAVTDVTEITAPGHPFGDWYTVKEATFTEEGIKERVCTVCSYLEQEGIPVLEHKEYVDADSGVKVTVGKDAYDGKDVQVDIKEVFDGSHYLIPGFANQKGWDITTLVDGEEAQPSAPVYVQIPLPEGFNAKKVAVYHINSQTGEREKVDAQVIDGYVCFLAESFSVYVVVDESSAVEEDPSANCTHMCHDKGFFVFFWKIVQFFSKLFGVNAVCSCGAAHY